jgi:hypothetical protein
VSWIEGDADPQPIPWLKKGTHVTTPGGKGTVVDRLPGLIEVVHVSTQENYPYFVLYDPALVHEDPDPAQ